MYCMPRIVIFFIIVLGFNSVIAQEFLWASASGSKKTESVYEMLSYSTGYILPVIFRDSFYTLNKWNHAKSDGSSLYLEFYNKNGKLWKLIKLETDSIKINYFTGVNREIISILEAELYDGYYFEGIKYNSSKEKYLLELDTFGKIKRNLSISCTRNGIAIEPRYKQLMNTRIDNHLYITIELLNKNSNYLCNNYTVNTKDKNVIVNLILDSNLNIIKSNTIDGLKNPSIILNSGDDIIIGSYLNSPLDTSVIDSKPYLFESFNNCIVTILDKEFKIKNTFRVPGSQIRGIRNTIDKLGNGTFMIITEVFSNKEGLKMKVASDSIELSWGGNVLITLFSGGKIKSYKLFKSISNKYSFSMQGNSIVTSDEYAVVTGQIGNSILILPDSIIINNTSDDGDFICMKLDTFGNFLWQFRIGKNGTSEYAKNSKYEKNGVIIGGTFDGKAVLGNFILNSVGQSDALIFKITDNSIIRGSVSEGSYCAGDSIFIPYRAYGKYNDTNTFYAELSDENGNFYGSHRVLGSLSSTGSGTIRGALPLFDVITSGKYRIRIRSNSPFVQSFMRYDSLKLLIYSKDKASPGPDTTVCYGQKLTIMAKGGSLWHWSPGKFVKDSTARKTEFSAFESTRLRIAIGDSSGCGDPDTAYQVITVIPPPKAISYDTVVCKNEWFVLRAKSSGGLQDSMRYKWIYADTFSEEKSLNWKTEKPSQVLLVVHDGCSPVFDTGIFHVNFPGSPLIFSGDTIVCINKRFEYTAQGKGYAGRKMNFHWYKNGVEMGADTLIDKIAQKMNYLLVGTDQCSPDSTKQPLSIDIHPLPEILSSVDSICARERHTLKIRSLKGREPYSYYLNNVKVDSANIIQLQSKDSIIHLNAEDACGQMSATDTVRLFKKPLANLQASPQQGCYPLEVTLTSLNPGSFDQYWWMQDSIPYPNMAQIQKFNILRPGITKYYVALSNINCSDTAMTSVLSHPNPVAAMTITRRDLLVTQATTRAINLSAQYKNYIWQWNGNSKSESTPGSINLEFKDTGKFKVLLIAENEFGCRDTASEEVRIHPTPVVWIPNALSMNEDGLNEELKPGGLGIKAFNLLVFNKWGQMVFKGDENQSWVPEKEILLGMYIYRCVFSDWSGEKFDKSGTVMVLR